MLRDQADRFLAVRGRTPSFRRQDNGVNKPSGIPTIGAWDELNIPIYADIIRQVVSGHVGYSGLGSQFETPDHSGEFHHYKPRTPRTKKPEPVTDTRAQPQSVDIQAAFKRAWSLLPPEAHPMEVDTQRLAEDRELKAAFSVAYRKLKG